MKGGQTRPFIVLAQDEAGQDVQLVLKVRQPDNTDNHFGPSSLACELICSMLARALGLSVPDYAIVTVDDEFADSVTDAPVKATLLQNLGPNFGSQLVEGATDWDEEYAHASPPTIQLLEDILCFDAVTLNDDRRASRPNLLWRGQDLTLIDHSLALTVFAWRPGGTTPATLLADQQIRDHCAFKALVNKARPYTALIGRWAATVLAADLAAIRAQIPAAWETEPGHLDQIFGFLNLRQQAFQSITLGLGRVVK